MSIESTIDTWHGTALLCGHRVGPEDILVRVQGDPKDFLICEGCWKPGRSYRVASAHVFSLFGATRSRATDPTPCAGCGRHVVRGKNDKLLYITCSKYCTVRASKQRHGTVVPPSVKPCQGCGHPMSTRVTSAYCSGGCRHRAAFPAGSASKSADQ